MKRRNCRILAVPARRRPCSRDDGGGDPRASRSGAASWPTANAPRGRLTGRFSFDGARVCLRHLLSDARLELPDHAGMVSPSARAAKVNAMRCLGRFGQIQHVVDRGRVAPIEQRAARTPASMPARRAGPDPGDRLGGLAASRAGARQSAPARGLLRRRTTTGRRRTRRCRRHQVVGRHRGLGLAPSAPVVFEQDAPLCLAIRIVDIDLHQEAVELRLGSG